MGTYSAGLSTRGAYFALSLVFSTLASGCLTRQSEKTQIHAQTFNQGVLTPPAGGPTTDGSLGARLYAENCASCHGSLSVSVKRGRSADDISRAIQSVIQMRHLRFLDPGSINAIYAALTEPTHLPLHSANVSDFKPLIGSATYFKSVLVDVFVKDPVAETALMEPIQDLIEDQVHAFGGTCTRYDLRCVGAAAVNQEQEMLPPGTLPRSGYLIRACEALLAQDQAVLNALVKAGLTESSAFSQTNIEKLFAHFYPDRPSSAEALSALLKVVLDAQGLGLPARERWRYLMLPMCLSSLTDLI